MKFRHFRMLQKLQVKKKTKVGNYDSYPENHETYFSINEDPERLIEK